MTQPKPRLKFTVDDYRTTPEDKRYQLLNGDLILAPSPTNRHQTISAELYSTLRQFINENRLGHIWYAPFDVFFSDYDVAQPDILFVSSQRSQIITEANIQGAPDLVVEILSPSTVQYDRGYKRTLYGRHGVQEYWMVDPEAEIVEVLTLGDEGLTVQSTYQRSQEELTSPLLAGLSVSLEQIFG